MRQRSEGRAEYFGPYDFPQCSIKEIFDKENVFIEKSDRQDELIYFYSLRENQMGENIQP